MKGPGRRRSFHADEITIAIAAGLLAQLSLIAMLASPTPPLVLAEISDEKARPIAVEITPIMADVPAAKLGSRTAAKNPWARAKPVEKKDDSVLPSTAAKQTPEAIPTERVSTDAGPPTLDPSDAQAPSGAAEDAAPAPADATPGTAGDPNGVPDGSDDPLFGRAKSDYKSRLAAFFRARFYIKGQIPFEQLEKLRATVTVSISNRKVTGFSVAGSGDPIFDQQVRSAVFSIQSSGVEVPAPPPAYPQLLGAQEAITFSCTVRAACE